jgi:hypothetical protein
MNKMRGLVLGMAIAIFGLAAPGLPGQAPRTGQQIPPMPRVADPGTGGWFSLGASPWGFLVVVSRQAERTAMDVFAAYYLDDESFSGATLGLSLGLPLSTGRVFAEVGGGPGLMIVSWESANKTLLCLNAGLQLSVRFSSRLALGLYSTVGVSTKKTLGGIFLCLQYGRWEF